MNNYERPGRQPGGVDIPLGNSEGLAALSVWGDSTSSITARSQDCHLVERLKLRDHNAMVDLYDKCGELAYSVISRIVRNPATAEDLTQETFLRIWRRIHSFDVGRGQLNQWVAAIARNIAIDHLRSLRREPLPWDEMTKSARAILRNEEADRLMNRRSVNVGFALLNLNQRKVLQMTYFEGLTQTEIAERMQKPLGTIKSLVRSSLKVLRSNMQKGDPSLHVETVVSARQITSSFEDSARRDENITSKISHKPF